MNLANNNEITELGFFGKAGIILCTRGWRKLSINGEHYVQRPGMLLIASPIFVIQDLGVSEDYECVSIFDEIHIFFGVINQVAKITAKVRIIQHPCIELKEEMQQFIIERARQIEQRRAEIAQITEEGELTLCRLANEAMVKQTVIEAMLYVYRNTPWQHEAENTHMDAVFNFVYQVHLQFREHRTVSYYAEQARLSTNYFSAIVKRAIGISPSELIVAFTISNAKILLDQTSKSIKEVAGELGFPEQFTFRKYFKNYTGMSPKEYRGREREKK